MRLVNIKPHFFIFRLEFKFLSQNQNLSILCQYIVKGEMKMKIKIDDDYGNIEDKEIVHDNTDENIITYESYEVESIDNKKENVDIRGKIKVISRLGNKDGTLISSSKINLYMLNGISPRLISSKLTNEKVRLLLLI